MSDATFCWQCGGKLDRFGSGKVKGVMVTPPGGGPQVRVHKVCAEGLKKAEPEFSMTGVKRDVHRYLGDDQGDDDAAV